MCIRDSHYSAETWNLAGEFDYGQNAFNLGNLFSGSGPLDAFGTATGKSITSGTPFGPLGPSCSSSKPCYNVFNTFGPQTAVWQALLQNGRERNIGWDVFGHFLIPDTKLTAFGMFQWFRPNDNVAHDPLDFMRFVAGVSYQYNEYLRIALDSQNLLFYHANSGLTTMKAARFNYPSAGSLNGRVAANGRVQYFHSEPGAARHARSVSQPGVRVLSIDWFYSS